MQQIELRKSNVRCQFCSNTCYQTQKNLTHFPHPLQRQFHGEQFVFDGAQSSLDPFESTNNHQFVEKREKT
jgi:hypothetical protein